MQKVLQTGNSLAVVIPSRFVELVGIKKGDSVRVIKKPELGRLIYIFSGSKQLPLELSAKRVKK